MKSRVHIVLPAEEKERYRAIAEREGTTLSEWMRAAVREKATRYDADRKLETTEELEAFFLESDRAEAGDACEPDWEEHERLIQEGRGHGLQPG